MKSRIIYSLVFLLMFTGLVFAQNAIIVKGEWDRKPLEKTMSGSVDVAMQKNDSRSFRDQDVSIHSGYVQYTQYVLEVNDKPDFITFDDQQIMIRSVTTAGLTKHYYYAQFDLTSTEAPAGSYTFTADYTLQMYPEDSGQQVTLTINVTISGEAVEVMFYDTALETVVRQALGKTTGEITRADMESLTELNAEDAGVQDLSGLEHAVNLVKLTVSNFSLYFGKQASPFTVNGQFKNRQPGAVLEYTEKKAKRISPENSRGFSKSMASGVRNLEPLSTLEKLKQLDLSFNQIEDISVLSTMTELEVLELGFNVILSIDAVKNLSKLRELGAGWNEISDISPLANIITLEGLILDDNWLESFQPLEGLTQIQLLSLTNTNLQGLNNIAMLKKIETLYLDENNLSDISILSGFQSLNYLQLDHNSIADIAPLTNLTGLTDLGLSNNRLEDDDLASLYSLDQLNNEWIRLLTDDAYFGEYGYLDLRGNIGFSQSAIQELADALPKIDDAHILYDLNDTAADDMKFDQQPSKFCLFANYPNPFNPATKIEYHLEHASNVQMTIYNLKGEQVDVLVDAHQPAGHHIQYWDASIQVSGVYFCVLKADNHVESGKLLLQK